MKAYRLFALLLMAVLIVSSCSSTYKARPRERDTLRLLNMNHEELINEFGAPIREMSNGDNGYILVFSGQNVFKYEANKFGGSLPELQCYMNNDGYCYDVVTKNTQTRATSAGKTIILVFLLVGLLGMAA